jgi:murein DD-endopeptidase MepM/ murein hydrolase activator NlpD
MQILITHGRFARVRAVHLSMWQLALCGLALLSALLLVSGTVYHFVFLKAAREGWPVVSQIVRLVVRDEIEQRDRYMRENLDAMAQKVGEVQAKVVRLEAVGERVSGLAGLKSDELRNIDDKQPAPLESKVGRTSAPAGTAGSGRGGPYVPLHSPSLTQLNEVIAQLDARTDLGSDMFTLAESRLSERRLNALLVPSIAPVDGAVGSGFGFRYDPFSGRPALHTGLDFPADVGTPIAAAAGGVVISADVQPSYGLTVEIDHGNGLVTRYGHTSKVLVKAGDLVRRGERIALVGNSGRSTGPHLHFEVLLDGAPQNPERFLAQGRDGRTTANEADVATRTTHTTAHAMARSSGRSAASRPGPPAADNTPDPGTQPGNTR